jgi:hypothetical protein
MEGTGPLSYLYKFSNMLRAYGNKLILDYVHYWNGEY